MHSAVRSFRTPDGVTLGVEHFGDAAAPPPAARGWHDHAVLARPALSDAVVVEVLGVLSNCPASDAEPTMFMTMQHSARRRRLRPMRRALAHHRAGDGE